MTAFKLVNVSVVGESATYKKIVRGAIGIIDDSCTASPYRYKIGIELNSRRSDNAAGVGAVFDNIKFSGFNHTDNICNYMSPLSMWYHVRTSNLRIVIECTIGIST
jgi:hypothetical protein